MEGHPVACGDSNGINKTTPRFRRLTRAQPNIKWENMKLSVEAKVAAAVAAGFLGLAAGAMAQGRHKGQTGGRNDFGPTSNPGNNAGVQMHMSQQESSKSSLFDRTNAEENRQKFSDENVTSSTGQQREDRHDASDRERERSRTNGEVREGERERSGTNGDVRERERERNGTNGNVRERERSGTNGDARERERERSGTNGNVREREREKPNGVVEEQRQEQRTNAAGQTQTRSQERTRQPNP